MVGLATPSWLVTDLRHSTRPLEIVPNWATRKRTKLTTKFEYTERGKDADFILTTTTGGRPDTSLLRCTSTRGERTVHGSLPPAANQKAQTPTLPQLCWVVRFWMEIFNPQ